MKLSSGLRNGLVLVAVMGVAIFFRFYRLDAVPPGLYPDVAINGMDAIDSLQTGNYKLFYPENNGREGLMMWLDAASMAIFGISAAALKIPAAIIGALTVWGVYLLTRRLFDPKKQSIALLAAFFCATSFWHINFSRIGFRAIIVPFCLVFSFYFLWRAFKEKKVWPALVSGLFFGLGFYTYPAFRLAVPLLFCALALWLVVFWKNKETFIKISAAALLATFFSALPIGFYFLRHPADFFGRANQTSVFSSSQPLLELGKSLALHLGMFNFFGDGNWRHNLPGAPELFLPVGILFLIGLLIAGKQIFKKSNDNAKITGSFILLWFFFMLLPGVLTSEGIPHALRTLGVIPAVMIISGMGGFAAYDWLKSRISKIALRILAIIFIGAALINGYCQYFIVWAQNPNVAAEFTVPYADIGKLAGELHSVGYQTVIIVNVDGVAIPYPDGMPMPAQTIKFIENENCYQGGIYFRENHCDSYSQYVLPSQINTVQFYTKIAFIPMKDEQPIFSQLQNLYPQGQIKIINNIRYYEINQ